MFHLLPNVGHEHNPASVDIPSKNLIARSQLVFTQLTASITLKCPVTNCVKQGNVKLQTPLQMPSLPSPGEEAAQRRNIWYCLSPGGLETLSK